MPRSNRTKSFTKVYHVIIRGINKQDIFLDKQDYLKFLKELQARKGKYKSDIFAYALMQNHVHLVIHDKSDALSKLMQSLTISYSNYFNKKYERIGHLFENRFKSYAIEDAGYLRNLVRYIHKNPENAGRKPYIWTSYFEYINNKSTIIENSTVMKLFDNNMQNFKAFHDEYKKNQDYNKNFEMLGRLQDDEAIELIKKIINESNLLKIQNYEQEKKEQIIRRIIEIKGITKVQISRILGISRSTINRLIKMMK